MCTISNWDKAVLFSFGRMALVAPVFPLTLVAIVHSRILPSSFSQQHIKRIKNRNVKHYILSFSWKGLGKQDTKRKRRLAEEEWTPTWSQKVPSSIPPDAQPTAPLSKVQWDANRGNHNHLIICFFRHGGETITHFSTEKNLRFHIIISWASTFHSVKYV